MPGLKDFPATAEDSSLPFISQVVRSRIIRDTRHRIKRSIKTPLNPANFLINPPTTGPAPKAP